MKNSFSFQRFYALAKLNFATERRTIIAVGLSFVGFMMLRYIWPLMLNAVTLTDIDAAKCAAPSIAIIFGIAIVATSVSFRKYFKRSSASAAIMLPATNAEKFAAIFVRTLIVNIAVLFALSAIIYLAWATALGQPFRWAPWGVTGYWQYTVAAICMVHAILLFGATIFRRNALLYTLLSLIGLAFIFSSIISPFLQKSLFINLDMELVKTIFIATQAVIAAGLWIWSYIRFTKIQITK